MKAIWGKNEKDLGITYQPCTCEVVTSVIFDKNHKLIIGGEKTDLFANFKNLQPGCTRSQTIRLANNSDLNIKMSLRAEAAKQNKYSKKNLELIRKLLTLSLIHIFPLQWPSMLQWQITAELQALRH